MCKKVTAAEKGGPAASRLHLLYCKVKKIPVNFRFGSFALNWSYRAGNEILAVLFSYIVLSARVPIRIQTFINEALPAVLIMNTNMTIFYSASLFYSKEKPKLCRIMHKGHGPYGERPAFKLIMLLQLQGIARFFRPGLMWFTQQTPLGLPRWRRSFFLDIILSLHTKYHTWLNSSQILGWT